MRWIPYMRRASPKPNFGSNSLKKSVGKKSLGVSVQQPKFFPPSTRMHVVGLIGSRPISLTLEGYSASNALTKMKSL